MDVQQALYHSIQKKLCALPASSQLKSIPFWELVEGLSQNLGIIQWFSVGSDFYPEPTTRTLGRVWRCRLLSQMGWMEVNRSQGCCWAFYSAEHSPISDEFSHPICWNIAKVEKACRDSWWKDRGLLLKSQSWRHSRRPCVMTLWHWLAIRKQFSQES